MVWAGFESESLSNSLEGFSKLRIGMGPIRNHLPDRRALQGNFFGIGPIHSPPTALRRPSSYEVLRSVPVDVRLPTPEGVDSPPSISLPYAVRVDWFGR